MKRVEYQRKSKFEFTNDLLIVDRENEFIEGSFGSIPFSEIKGLWKNSHKKIFGMVYYIKVLTRDRIIQITPNLKKEEDADKIEEHLKKVLRIK